jgi:hypothetical protein
MLTATDTALYVTLESITNPRKGDVWINDG